MQGHIHKCRAGSRNMNAIDVFILRGTVSPDVSEPSRRAYMSQFWQWQEISSLKSKTLRKTEESVPVSLQLNKVSLRYSPETWTGSSSGWVQDDINVVKQPLCLFHPPSEKFNGWLFITQNTLLFTTHKNV